MSNVNIQDLKKNIVAIGRLLWEKELVSGLNGNMSVRVDDESIVLTATQTCLGLLNESDILHVNLEGEPLEEGNVSTEKLLHTEVYKRFPEINAVIHTHTNYTNGYFLENETFSPKIFESKLHLGEVKSVDQKTPAVTDASPVIDALKSNNIIVLRNHGVVAMGKDLFDCFLLIQGLEDGIKVDFVSRLYRADKSSGRGGNGDLKAASNQAVKRYKLFSQEQIDDIVKLVNADTALTELGEKTKMTMDLAVKLDETGEVYSFNFKNGKIVDVGNDENAEFLISAPSNIWKAVFNQEIDPFVATTQKKMNLRGDFAKISKWYAPCSRIFELWQQVPVE